MDLIHLISPEYYAEKIQNAPNDTPATESCVADAELRSSQFDQDVIANTLSRAHSDPSPASFACGRPRKWRSRLRSVDLTPETGFAHGHRVSQATSSRSIQAPASAVGSRSSGTGDRLHQPGFSALQL